MHGDDIAVEELAARAAAGLSRRLRAVDGPQDTWVTVDGRRVLSLCSNNYLGLANHPALREAAESALRDYGVGAGASRLISGSMRLHHELEGELAAFKGTQAALLFNSGYHANLGAITALVHAGDAVFSDELNHASIIDGCRLSRAQVVVYPHKDAERLAQLVAATRARRKLIVTDSVFSMDGDIAPLRAICDVAEQNGALVMVDEAHATGVIGEHGAGVVAAEGLASRVALQMGTLGKALGSFGAYVAASRPLIEMLINEARSFIYTTALPPAIVAAARAALRIVQSEPERRQQLFANAQFLATELRRLGLQLGDANGHILPVMIGDATLTMRLTEQLLHAGVFVQGIRPPTVPPHTARLRVTMTAAHSADDLQQAVRAFAQVWRDEAVHATA